MNYKEVLKILKDNGDFDYINDLSEKELDEVLDFEEVYKKILNLDNNSNLDFLITLIFTFIIKMYFDYKEVYPFIPSNEVKYSNYFIQPVDGKYSLLDFLINVLIENIQVISSSNFVFNSYSFAHRELCLKANRYEGANLSPLNKAQLYYKSICHEVGHAMHSVVSNNNDNVILRLYNPFSCNRVKSYNDLVFEFYKKFHLYRSLSSKYNILDEKSFHFEFSPGYTSLPSGFHDPILEEAFTEMKAEDYMGVDPVHYIRKLGDYSFLSYTIGNGYSLMANYLRTFPISKKDEFQVAFLGYPGEMVFSDYDNLIHYLLLLHPEYDYSDEEKYNIFKKRYLEDSNPNNLYYPFLIEGSDYIFMDEILFREKNSHRC